MFNKILNILKTYIHFHFFPLQKEKLLAQKFSIYISGIFFWFFTLVIQKMLLFCKKKDLSISECGKGSWNHQKSWKYFWIVNKI